MANRVSDVHMLNAQDSVAGYLVGMNLAVVPNVNPVTVLKLVQAIKRSGMRCPMTSNSNGIATAGSTRDRPERWPCIHVHRDRGL